MFDTSYQGSAPIPALAGDLAVAMVRSANEVLRDAGLTSGGPYPEVRDPIAVAATEIAKWALARQQTSEDSSTPPSDV
jgi:hypothetical protein